MLKRISILCGVLLLALSYSFTDHHEERVDFSRAERRMLHIPTAGLFDGADHFTVTPADLKRDGWCFPVVDGVVFTPEFRHEPVGWYIMSAEERHEVRAAMEGVVRLVRKTDLGKTVVILHPNGLETVYAHHAKTLVRSGDYVAAGQPVAQADADHGAVYTYFTMMGDIESEDSLYWFLAPTNKIWREHVDTYKNYFVYHTELGEEGDSLQNLYAKELLTANSFFSVREQEPPFNEEDPDSIISTTYSPYDPDFSVFEWPKRSGGILEGLTPQECSNGLLYTATDWRMKPTDLNIMSTIKVEAGKPVTVEYMAKATEAPAD